MSKRIIDLPEHVPGTSRDFKVRKRTELRSLAKALEVFRLGCAYTPIHGQVEVIQRQIDEAKVLLSERFWGR